MTDETPFEKLSRQLRELLWNIAEDLGIVRLTDWLARKLESVNKEDKETLAFVLYGIAVIVFVAVLSLFVTI